MARLPNRSDEEILSLMTELRARQRIVSVATLRQELHRRYGIRAGTQRIYKLVKAAPPTAVSRAPPAAVQAAKAAPDADARAEIARLTAERDAALARAQLSEIREMATQDRTANEIWNLRQEVKRLKVFRV
jgi:hypothetical protein